MTNRAHRRPGLGQHHADGRAPASCGSACGPRRRTPTDLRLLAGAFARAVDALRTAEEPAAAERVVPLSPHQVNRRLQVLAAALGLEGVSSHSGRRGLASELRVASGGRWDQGTDQIRVEIHAKGPRENKFLEVPVVVSRARRSSPPVRELAEPVGEVAFPLPAQPRDPMRGDIVEEAFRNSEAPEVFEAVQQPVGVGGIVARLELPEPDEPRHAGVDRLFEQILEVAPKPGRNPLGDAGFGPAFRVDQRVGADPLDSSSWPAGWFACDGRPRRTCAPGPRSTAPVALLRGAGPRAHAPRRPRRTGIRTGGAVRQDARVGSRTAPRSRRVRPHPGRAGVR